MAEALLHRPCADRARTAGLKGQGRASARGSAVIFVVAHALALLAGRMSRPSSNRPNRYDARNRKVPPASSRLLAPTLWKERAKPRQAPDFQRPAIGGTPRKEGGVYHILGPQGQTQFLSVEESAKLRRFG